MLQVHKITHLNFELEELVSFKIKALTCSLPSQVENSTLGSRGAALLAQNSQLQGQQSSVEGEREGALRDREELRCAHELLLRDHDKLAALHERQAAEYEALITKHGALKGHHKGLEAQHRELEDRCVYIRSRYTGSILLILPMVSFPSYFVNYLNRIVFFFSFKALFFGF